MRTGFRFRCYPTPKQQQILLQWIGCQRFIYNAKVSEDRYFRSFAKKSLSLVGQYPPIDQKYSQFKTELTPWLKDVPSHILRNGAFLWKQAYSLFFQKLGGRPKFKSKSDKQSVYITNELFTFTIETNKQTGAVFYHLVIGNKKFLMGEVKYIVHRIHQIPKSIVISIDAGKWYIFFSNEDNQILIKPEDIAEELKQWSEEDLINAATGIVEVLRFRFVVSGWNKQIFYQYNINEYRKKKNVVNVGNVKWLAVQNTRAVGKRQKIGLLNPINTLKILATILHTRLVMH